MKQGLLVIAGGRDVLAPHTVSPDTTVGVTLSLLGDGGSHVTCTLGLL